MRILVTGGLGIVGTGLISELRSRGHYVVSWIFIISLMKLDLA